MKCSLPNLASLINEGMIDWAQAGPDLLLSLLGEWVRPESLPVPKGGGKGQEMLEILEY